MTTPTRRLRAVALVCLAGGSASLVGCAGVDSSPPKPESISGRYIAVVCDADMGATALADGNLARPSPSAKDSLTVVALPISSEPASGTSSWQTGFAQIEVSNSVMGPPTALAVTKDGTMAFVAESRGPAPAGASRVSDLPPGRVVTPIDLTDPMNPVRMDPIDVHGSASGVDVHPSGEVLAVVTSTPGSPLVLATITNRMVDPPLGFPLIGIADPKAAASSVAWHPSGRYLAVTLPELNQVAFYEFTRSGANGGMELAAWGDPVPVGKFPFMGKFTPDGKYYISTNLHWGADVADYLVGAPEGDLSVIRLSSVPSSVPAPRAEGAEAEPAPSVVHQVVSTAQVGISPEGLAISNDGAWIATANLRRSMLATSDPRATLGGSVSLLSLDSAEGTLTNHGEWELPGMPEGLTFDSKSRHIVVTQFRSLDPNAVDGELAFFKVVPAMKGEGPKLVPGDFYVGVGTGPHGVVIVR